MRTAKVSSGVVALLILLFYVQRSPGQDPEWKHLADQGAAAYNRHDYSAAENLLSQAASLQEQAGMYRRPIDPVVVHLKYALAETYRAQKRYDDAMREYRWGLAALIMAPYDKAFPRAGLNLEPDTAIGDKLKYPDNIPSSADAAKILNGMACIYRDQGRYNLAGELFERVLKMCRESESFYGGILNTYGPKPLNAAQVMVNIADMYNRQDLFGQAEAEYKAALQEIEKKDGTESPSLIPVLLKLSQFYQSLGRLDEARDVETRANSIRANNGT